MFANRLYKQVLYHLNIKLQAPSECLSPKNEFQSHQSAHVQTLIDLYLVLSSNLYLQTTSEGSSLTRLIKHWRHVNTTCFCHVHSYYFKKWFIILVWFVWSIISSLHFCLPVLIKMLPGSDRHKYVVSMVILMRHWQQLYLDLSSFNTDDTFYNKTSASCQLR